MTGGWERLLRERTCDLEAGLDGRTSTALCWHSRMLRSQVQLLYLDNSPLLGFLRDAPVFGTPGSALRESWDQGMYTFFVVFFSLASDSRNSAQITQSKNISFPFLPIGGSRAYLHISKFEADLLRDSHHCGQHGHRGDI